MRLVVVSFLLVFSGVIAAGPVGAAEISSQLADRMAAGPADSLFRVVLELAKPVSLDKSLAVARSQAMDRGERYRQVRSDLELSHQRAQEPVVARLRALQRNKTAATFRQHWLVNAIEADLTAAEIQDLATRSDITRISLLPVISTVPIDDPIPTDPRDKSVSTHLTAINAPAAWALGYTGRGRIVCSFDTGVDGDHPALFSRWKGHDGDSAAAWFDPVKQEPFPHAITDCNTVFFPCRPTHGTHTLGLAVGRDTLSNDTIGVAIDAEWISAAVIDIAGASIIEAFEWAANPDGDPNSVDDVPDVINHSWVALYLECENLYYDLIDNTEALGIVNVFSAGNITASLGTESTIGNPANRADDSLDCFAVGAWDTGLNQIWSTGGFTSARGPSICPGGRVKPNVVAPGASITSSIPGGGYGELSGTSMAAPMVSGLVALLREKNPNATVDQIKSAILNSADDLGQTIPNNTIGWGMIDCAAALAALPAANPSPNIRVYSFDYAPVAPGGTVQADLVLENLGAAATNVNASLSGSDPLLSINVGTSSFGPVGTGDTVRGATELSVEVDPSAPPGAVLSLDLDITAGGGYAVTRTLFFLVDPPQQRGQITHDAGNIEITLTNYGMYGVNGNSFAQSFFPRGGSGLRYQAGANDMYQGALIIGTGDATVSDAAANAGGEPDGDFAVLPDGDIRFVLPPKAGVAQQSVARFSDSLAENPLGLEIVQNSFAFSNSPYQDLVIVEYIITNSSLTSLNNLLVGIFVDWDVTAAGSNAGGWETSDQFGWAAYNSGTLSDYRGIAVVNGQAYNGYTALSSILNVTSSQIDTDDGFQEAEKFFALGTTTSNLRTAAVDIVSCVSIRIPTLAAGATDTAAFAFIAGEQLVDIQTAADESRNAYNGIVLSADDEVPDELPDRFNLRQNYPNPFNPATTISFDLPVRSDYRLTIYNLVGQQVAVFEGESAAGVATIEWDASGLASGIYLYRLSAGGYTASKKMLLLK